MRNKSFTSGHRRQDPALYSSPDVRASAIPSLHAMSFNPRSWVRVECVSADIDIMLYRIGYGKGPGDCVEYTESDHGDGRSRDMHFVSGRSLADPILTAGETDGG